MNVQGLIVGLVLSFVTMAFGYEAEEANGYTWVYQLDEETNEAEIQGLTTRPSGTLKFPSSLGGAPVKNLQLWLFEYCWKLRDWDESGEYSYWNPDYATGNDWLFDVTKVVIPSSVTNISNRCFSYQEPRSWTDEEGNEHTSKEWGWKNLKSVSLPDSIVRCDAQTFYGTPFYFGKTFCEPILSSSGKTLYGVKEMVYEDYRTWMTGDVRIPATVTRLADRSAIGWWFSSGRMIFEGARPSATTAAFVEVDNQCADSCCETMVLVTNQNVQVVYYADPNAKGWKWGGSWCGVKTYSLDVVPPADRAASSLTFGPDVYSYEQSNLQFSWYPFSFDGHFLERKTVIDLHTGSDVTSYASEAGRWFVLPVTGAKSAAEIKPVIAYGSATSEQVKGVSVWTDEQLRARAMPALSTKSEWKLVYWSEPTYTYNNCNESVSDIYEYEWPKSVWPKNKAVSGRYWVVVELNQRDALGSSKWSGDYTFKVGLKGTSEWSPVLHVIYNNPEVLTPAQIFRGVTLGGYEAARIDDYDEREFGGVDFEYLTGSLTIALPEAGTLYLYGDTNDRDEEWPDDEYAEEANSDCIDKKTLKITGENILSDKVVDPWGGYWESEEQWEQLRYQTAGADIIRVVKVGGKTTLSLRGMLDVYHETDFQRIQFFPNSKKAVAVEVAMGSMVMTEANRYHDYDGYLQGKVSGAGVYKSGETVKLVATPGSGETFDGWEVLAGSVPKGTDLTSKTLTFKVTDSIAGKPDQRKQIVVRAKWRPKYGVYGYPTVAGRATITGGGLFFAGKTATLTVKPASGCTFLGWTDGNKDNPRTVKAVAALVDHVFYAIVEDTAQKKADDKAALKFNSATKKLATTPVSATASVAFSFALGFSALADAEPIMTVSSLPDGLTFSSANGKVSGTVKKPGSYTAKVTVKTKLGNKITQNVKIDVKAPSWATGTFSGYGAVIVKGETVPVSATFTATAVGKVSGKVIYKGRSAPFTASYASATDTESRFTVSFSADGVKFKSAMSIKQKTSGLTFTQAHALAKDSFELELQKTVPLAQKDKSLEKMIGNSYTFKQGYEGSGLSKSGDKLVVKFADKDVVKLSGVVKGKSFTGLSASLMACGKSKKDGTTKYKLNVPVIAGTVGYYRLLTFKVTIDTATKKVTKVEKAFAKVSLKSEAGQ